MCQFNSDSFMGKRLTTFEFIKRASVVHGDMYSYDETNYINSRSEVMITCPDHGDFTQLAGNHLQGHGCPSCCGNKQSNTAEFIEKSKVVHGSKYSYNKVKYTRNNVKVVITCLVHGDFKQLPVSHLYGHGCGSCRDEGMFSNTCDFIERSKLIHGMKYSYSKVNYIHINTKVIITCADHGDFMQQPASHLQGKGCLECGGKKQSNTEEFIDKAKIVHGSKYNYSKVDYAGVSSKVVITCADHGDFTQSPNQHLQGCGCPSCSTVGFDVSKQGYLYVLVSECGSYMKIGISGNTDQRLKKLTKLTPFVFSTIEILSVSGTYALPFEQALHSISVSAGFKGFDGATEWFKYDREVVDTAVTMTTLSN